MARSPPQLQQSSPSSGSRQPALSIQEAVTLELQSVEGAASQVMN
jgi:hypothetical protein